MSVKRRDLGRAGEKQASSFLRSKGYRILHNNYRGRGGEIDLIARDGATIVFIEVKTRSSNNFGSPLAAITPKKQHHLSMVAQEYLARHRLFDTDARFDVVGVLYDGGKLIEIDHIENAFEASYGG